MLRNKTVLIVDDNPADRFFLHLALTDLYPGCKTYTAADASQALTLLHADMHPDFIFMDINMPGMSGLECLESLKHSEDIRDIPVFICSSSNSRDEVKQAEKLGALGFVVKQSSLEVLEEKLKEVITQALPNSG